MQDPPIVIECDGCKARFRIDRKLFQGHKGAQVRCRKCGGTIRITISGNPIPAASTPQTPRDPAEAPPLRFAAPALPRIERASSTRSTVVARSLLEEETESGPTTNILINLQKSRGFDRRNTTAGAFDISNKITAEIPHTGLPSPEAIPEAEPRSPADSPAVQPAPGKPSSTRGSRIFEEPFQQEGQEPVTLPKALEKSLPSPSASRVGGFWRRLTRRFGPSTTFLAVVFGTTFSIFIIILLIRLLLQFTNWIRLHQG